MGEAGGDGCGLVERYTPLMRCEGVVIPTRGCVYFSLFICAPETRGRWNSPTSASALGDLVEIVFSVIMQIVDSHSTGIRHQESERYRVGGIVVGGQMRCNADQKNSIFSTVSNIHKYIYFG